MKPLIIGVDPGTTTGLAGVTFEGKVEFVESHRHLSRAETIEKIMEKGYPVIVTSDKAKTPSRVEKIASSVGAELFEPGKDLLQKEKTDKGLGDNFHELDASASAINAYNHMNKQIRKIKDVAEEGDVDLRQASKHFFDGEKLGGDNEEEASRGSKSDSEPEEGLEARLKRKIDRLEDRLENLESENTELEAETEKLEQKLVNEREKDRKEALKDEEVRKREGIIKDKTSEISRLEEKVEDLSTALKAYRQALKKIFGGGELVPIVDELDEVEEKAVFRSEESLEKVELDEVKLRHVEEIKGLELKDFVVVEDFPEKSFEKVIEEYRESR